MLKFKIITPRSMDDRLNYLLKCCKKYIDTEKINNQKKKFFWGEIRKSSSGLFPTGSFLEFYYAIHHYVMSQRPRTNEQQIFFQMFMNYIKRIKNINTEHFSEILQYIDISKYNSQIHTSFLEKQKQQYIGQMLFYLLDEKHPSFMKITTLIEIQIRLKVVFYRTRFENKEPLRFLANIARVLKGQAPLENPFLTNNKQLKGHTPTKKRFPTKSMHFMIDQLKRESKLTEFQPFVDKIYDHRLRNDDAHIQINSVDLDESLIISTEIDKDLKQKRSWSLTQINSLLRWIDGFHEAFFDSLFIEKLANKSLGIEHIQLKKTLQLDKKKILKASFILEISQFFYFNEVFDISTKSILVTVPFKRIDFFWFGYPQTIRDIQVKELSDLIKSTPSRNIKLKLISIAPLLSCYERHQHAIIKINNNKYYLINEVIKEIDLIVDV